MRLVVGLGNIGKKYEGTYHNAGFMFLESCVSEEFRLEKKFESYITRDGETIYALPTTFMNRSGDAVKKIIQYFDIPSDDVIVVHDDSDILLGDFKVQHARGSGGHHGIDSIFDQLGTREVTRIRIGVRPEGLVGVKASRFVLQSIPKEDKEKLYETFNQIKQEYSKILGIS